MKVIAKPIDMIAWYKSDGSIRPLKFKYESNEGKTIIVKINRIYSVDQEKIAGNPMYRFTCESIIRSTLRVFELKYNINTCQWILFKI